jgi:hypothetical protein
LAIWQKISSYARAEEEFPDVDIDRREGALADVQLAPRSGGSRPVPQQRFAQHGAYPQIIRKKADLGRHGHTNLAASSSFDAHPRSVTPPSRSKEDADRRRPLMKHAAMRHPSTVPAVAKTCRFSTPCTTR